MLEERFAVITSTSKQLTVCGRSRNNDNNNNNNSNNNNNNNNNNNSRFYLKVQKVKSTLKAPCDPAVLWALVESSIVSGQHKKMPCSCRSQLWCQGPLVDSAGQQSRWTVWLKEFRDVNWSKAIESFICKKQQLEGQVFIYGQPVKLGCREQDQSGRCTSNRLGLVNMDSQLPDFYGLYIGTV